MRTDYIENRSTTMGLKRIQTQFGPEAATLTRALLTAFAEGQYNPHSKAYADLYIARSLAQSVREKKIRMHRKKTVPDFQYKDLKGKHHTLFRRVSKKVQNELPCIIFYVDTINGREERIFQPDPLVGWIMQIASHIHQEIMEKKPDKYHAPIFDHPGTDVELTDLWAQEDMMIHMVDAAINTDKFIRGEEF